MDEAPTSSRDLGLEAYSRIRAAIRGGSLTPGERLTETDLAARFGVSRTPVRQAIARLEAEVALTTLLRRIPGYFADFEPGETVTASICGLEFELATYPRTDERYTDQMSFLIPVPESSAKNCDK